MTEQYFYDTYAIMELVQGNPAYERFKGMPVVVTKLNLFELYHRLLREKNEVFAREIFEEFENTVMDFDRTVIMDAAVLKLQHQKRKLSMTDCIGYIFALRNGLKFLTGDKQFADLPNVEFVK